jgi:hypothetical protein
LAEITRVVEQDPACQRLTTVPGIGPIISSAMVAAIGTGDAFAKGRDFGPWPGILSFPSPRRVLPNRSQKPEMRRFSLILWVLAPGLRASPKIPAEGVRRAISDLFAGVDLADAVQQGVRAAFDGHDIEGAVKQGVSDSFPWPSEIRGAIWDGTREAIER